MEDFVLTAPEQPERVQRSRRTPKITPAQNRVLAKAIQVGLVRREGGYSPKPVQGRVQTANDAERERARAQMDRGDVVDRLVGYGLLCPGEHANTYRPTAAALQRHQRRRKQGDQHHGQASEAQPQGAETAQQPQARSRKARGHAGQGEREGLAGEVNRAQA